MRNKKTWIVLTAGSIFLAGCEDDPLSLAQEPPDPPAEEPTDPLHRLPDPVIEPLPNVVDPVMPEPPLRCDDGRTGESWRHFLPPKLVPRDPGLMLGASTGAPAATCTGDPVVLRVEAEDPTVTSSVAHARGKWYFEATTVDYDEGLSHVSVFASPASPYSHQRDFETQPPVSVAARTVPGEGTISVAVDLDGARAFFFEDGVFVEAADLLEIPGVGAFHAGGVALQGSMQFNFGSEPFHYAVPAGYHAWSSGLSDASGACVSDAYVPAPSAPMRSFCDGTTSPCHCREGVPPELCNPLTTFEAESDDPSQLIILGVYDGGAYGVVDWALDADGHPVEVTSRAGPNGSVLVEVNRPGTVVLVLSAYELTDWLVIPGPDTRLSSVSVYGFYPPAVVGLDPSIPVDLHAVCDEHDVCDPTMENFPIGPFQWPFDIGGGATQPFVDAMEARFCLPLKVFGGVYFSRHLIVD